VKVLLLGTAAGGGFPQWNCACRLCVSCRNGTDGVPARSQDCLAVSATGAGWYLLNASPDIRSQVLAAAPLASGPGRRDTPLRGALLTDAELDHTVGLLMLREGAGLRVWAPPAVQHALTHDFPLRDVLSRYGGWDWQPVTPGGTVEVGDLDRDGGMLRVSAFGVSDKRPRYARSRPDGPNAAGCWVTAYRIEDPAGGGTLVYCPCMAAWPDGFDDLVEDADCVVLDGTFYSPDEMSTATDRATDSAAQRLMGHLPIAGAGGSLTRIRRHPAVRWVYTHLNNTNPVLDQASTEYAAVIAAGAELPPDGTALVIQGAEVRPWP
jgi:pyrroloquinoline quinone biosynthesis protein B